MRYGRLVRCLTGRWALASAASGQDVQHQEGDDDDRRRGSNDGNGGGGDNHLAILALVVPGLNRGQLRGGIDHFVRASSDLGPALREPFAGYGAWRHRRPPARHGRGQHGCGYVRFRNR
jgi:hypothetical protein